MKSKILPVIIAFLLLGCAPDVLTPSPSARDAQAANELGQNYVSLLDFELDQNASSLPPSGASLNFSADELLARRFRPFDEQGKPYATEKSTWAFKIYRPSADKSYYFANFRAAPQSWFNAQLKNANFAVLNSVALAAVTTANTALRNFPTDEGLYVDPKTPGKGYPFDYLQLSTLSIAQPLFVSHFSLDRAWAFVSDDTTWGWVKAEDLRILSEREAQAFKEQKFLTVKSDKTPVYDGRGNFIFYARVGAILGYLGENEKEFYGQIYTRSGLKSYKISKSVAARFPLKFNDENFREVANTLLNQPYGWGGEGDMRDCSLFTKDFLAGFGLWLPRNSKAQASMGEKISLKGLSEREKLKIIKERGVPYMTLVYLPGHIMLYVGARGEDLLVMHDAWGIKTNGGGRAIIGGTAITTLKIGAGRADVDEKSLLISKIDSINVLKAPPLQEQNHSAAQDENLKALGAFLQAFLRNLVPFERKILDLRGMNEPFIGSLEGRARFAEVKISAASDEANNKTSDATLDFTANDDKNAGEQVLDVSRTTPSAQAPVIAEQNATKRDAESGPSENSREESDLARKIARFEKAYGVKVRDNLAVFPDGSRVKFDSGAPNNDECSLNEASPKDMIAFDYAAFSEILEPKTDVGRCRSYEFLSKIYGGSESEVKKNLEIVSWLPQTLNLKLKFNSKNGAAQALKNVSRELDELVRRDPKMLEFLKNPGGTFKWRVIAGTNRLSAHSYAVAVDINVEKSRYWRWNKRYENLIPREIVEIFERNKFIWGGRWRHFDTMHFEYRPEFFE